MTVFFCNICVSFNIWLCGEQSRLKLLTLAYRHVRGDLVHCYKILHGIYDPLPSSILRLHRNCVLRKGARGHDLKLYFNRGNTNLRKHSFPIRVVKTGPRAKTRMVSQMKSFSPPI